MGWWWKKDEGGKSKKRKTAKELHHKWGKGRKQRRLERPDRPICCIGLMAILRLITVSGIDSM
jgi:hypothetical protein